MEGKGKVRRKGKTRENKRRKINRKKEKKTINDLA
jgi:hypothetical protein